eukprot:695738-Lingulodinium_polyedra.AAC.1
MAEDPLAPREQPHGLHLLEENALCGPLAEPHVPIQLNGMLHGGDRILALDNEVLGVLEENPRVVAADVLN